MGFKQEDFDLFRQWFESVQDVSTAYLEPKDYELAERLYGHLGLRVPNSVKAGKAAPASDASQPPKVENQLAP